MVDFGAWSGGYCVATTVNSSERGPGSSAYGHRAEAGGAEDD